MSKPKPHITNQEPMLISPREYKKWTEWGWLKDGNFTDKFPLKEYKRSTPDSTTTEIGDKK